VGLGFEISALHLQSGALRLVSHLQSILLWLFLEMGFLKFETYLPRLASNHDPPNLSLPNSRLHFLRTVHCLCASVSHSLYFADSFPSACGLVCSPCPCILSSLAIGGDIYWLIGFNCLGELVQRQCCVLLRGVVGLAVFFPLSLPPSLPFVTIDDHCLHPWFSFGLHYSFFI
jgi:hypothetical protein